ncbi:pyridoxamine 5'-phosphate oxidase family protein [Candidatus Pacearchaeota archaeon]|nr:pyridoxamine 5'-phosphate oxidase family protein [Candidatus Pacearchaeota archaeon]
MEDNLKVTSEVKKIIEENPLALATINENGEPYVIAVAYVKLKDGKLIITNNYMTNTLKNINQNNKVSLAVWDKDWAGYQINGTATYFEEGKYFDIVKFIKENEGEPCKGAIVVEINKIKRLA